MASYASNSTESLIMGLILEVQKYLQLYDTSLEAYKDAVKKQDIWEAVGVRVDMPGMASNSSSIQSVLDKIGKDKIGKDQLECSICSCRFRDPRVLDCLHSFCLECLQEISKQQEQDSEVISCPLCRCPTKLQDKDILDLSKNFTLTVLLDEIAMQEELHKGQGSNIKCQNCEEQNDADSRCVECDSFLCQECLGAHRRMAFLKTHKVHTLSQLRSESSLYKSRVREDAMKCGKHPDQTVNVYCDTCKKVACTTCSLLSHSHHTLQSLADASENCQQEIKQLINEAAKRKEEYSEVIEEVDKTRQALDAKYADINDKIHERALEEIAKIQEKEKKLQQEAKTVYNDKVQMLQKTQKANRHDLAENEQLLEEVRRIIDLASCQEIVNLHQKMKQNLMGLMEKRPGKVSKALGFMAFEPGNQSLGKLVLEEAPKPQVHVQTAAAKPRVQTAAAKPQVQTAAAKPPKKPPAEKPQVQTAAAKPQVQTAAAKPQGATKPPKQPEKWQLKTELKANGKFISACHVAVFSDNEIIVVDTNIKKLITYSSEEPQIRNLYDPRRVAVNKDNDLIVLAGPFIKVFDRYCNRLRQFQPAAYRNPVQNTLPTCLAVDDDNLIAVGYASKGEITLHQPDGSLVTILSAPGIGDYLALCKKRLIYTDCQENKVLAIDYGGDKIFTANLYSYSKRICSLYGVCCRIDGTIYVAASKQNESDDIHQFSPTGVYNGRIIKGCDSVRGIALSPNGNLVVAAKNSIKVYRNHRV